MAGKVVKAVLIGASMAAAQWLQDDFAIMANYDPSLSGNIAADEQMLVKYRDAYFNLLSGHNDNFAPNGWDFRGPLPSQEYKLARVARVGGLRSLVADRRTHDPAATANLSEISNLANDYRNLISPLSLRNVIYGYNFEDEPSIDHLKNSVLPEMSALANLENTKLMYTTLGGSWRGKAADSDPDASVSWANYVNYVDQYFNNPATRVASFDYYLFENQASSGYFTFPPGPGVTYFKHMKLFADKAAAKGKTFWGTPMSVTHAAGNRNYIIPSEAYLRYYAYSNMIYGAKGLVWFTYGLPGPRTGESYYQAPENDATLYGWLRNVNREVSHMGPFLMGLAWRHTVHSSGTDIKSGETGLSTFTSSDVFAASNPLLFTTSGCTGTCSNSLAAGVFKGGAEDYILFLNKTVEGAAQASTTADIAVRGNVKPKYFNKATRTFENFTATYNASTNTTTFGLAIGRGDGVFIWLDKGARIPAVLQEVLL